MKIMKKNILTILGLAAVMLLPTSCMENEYGTVDLTMPDDPDPGYVPIDATYNFSGMAGLYTEADFTRVKTSLDNGSAPAAVKEEFENLKKSSYASKNYTATPHQQIVRGDPTGTIENKQNYTDAMRDAAAAYQQTLLWRLTGDEDYAKNAMNILMAWAGTCTEITSNDADYNLAAGAQGYTFANAAQMLTAYSGWSAGQQDIFKSWIKNLFGGVNRTFLDGHAKGTGFQQAHRNVEQSLWDEHYWSNWDMVTLSSYLAIGILCQDNAIVNYVVNYFYDGTGNGMIKKLVRGTHQDPLGTGELIAQNQESGRDQGHAQMSTAVCLHLCQMAWSLYQGNPNVKELDFFSAEDNAVLHMAEYVALSNLRDGTDNANNVGTFLVTAQQMPFAEYHHCPGSTASGDDNDHIQLSEEQRGGARPGWEIVVNRYKTDNAYSKRLAEKIRPEGGAGEPLNRYGNNSGAFDQIGWNTLMLYQQ